MNFNDYQERVVGFVSQAAKESDSDMLLHACLGLAGETGEFVDMVKKTMYQGHDFDHDKARLELGDILFSVAEAAASLGFTMQAVAEGNMRKLEFRYPKGKFTIEDSINRKDK